MPRRGYKHLTIREDVFKKLEDVRNKYGFGSLGDAIAYLIRVEEEYRDMHRQLTAIAELLNKIAELLASKPPEDVGKKVEELGSEVSSLSVRLDILSRRIKELEAKMKNYEGRRS